MAGRRWNFQARARCSAPAAAAYAWELLSGGGSERVWGATNAATATRTGAASTVIVRLTVTGDPARSRAPTASSWPRRHVVEPPAPDGVAAVVAERSRLAGLLLALAAALQ
jgi:hypothetical protein